MREKSIYVRHKTASESTRYSIEGSEQQIVYLLLPFIVINFLFIIQMSMKNALRPYILTHYFICASVRCTLNGVHSVHESIRRYCPFAVRKYNNNKKRQ